MSAPVSRRRIAIVIVDRMQTHPRKQVVSELAAFLVEEHLTSSADLIMSDIETEFARRGHVIADVTTAHPLGVDNDNSSRSELTAFIKQAAGATSVELREQVDGELIGGVIIQTPGKYFDGSLQKQINNLMNMKTV